jgi:molybdopterin-guanine dinucleotide biosynthesis protein A
MDLRLPDSVTGLVLAGGVASRRGNADKGLEHLRGYPLIMHVIVRLAPQVASILISANRNLAAYEALGHPVVRDAADRRAGPLASLYAGLLQCQTELLLSVPCDAPLLAPDLALRLFAALARDEADVAVAQTGSQPHPLFCLMHRRLAGRLERFLAEGGRQIDTWQASLVQTRVLFDDEPDAFSGTHTPEPLRASEPTPD